MPKFDIIRAKCIYGFTQTPLISMNQNIAIATAISSTFLTNPNSQSNKMILHQNSMHQFSSTEKSSTLSCPLFKNMKLAQVSSTARMMCPFEMPYIKWSKSKVQHQSNLTKFSPTESSLTQLYNADPKLCTCAFIGFMVDADKNNFMFIGNKENTILPTIHQNIALQKITFQFNLLMYSIPSKTKNKTLFKLPTTLKGCVQTHFPPTVKQPLYYKSTMTTVTVASVSNQRRQLTRQLSTFPKLTVQTRQLEPTALFTCSPFQNKQICR